MAQTTTRGVLTIAAGATLSSVLDLASLEAGTILLQVDGAIEGNAVEVAVATGVYAPVLDETQPLTLTGDSATILTDLAGVSLRVRLATPAQAARRILVLAQTPVGVVLPPVEPPVVNPGFVPAPFEPTRPIGDLVVTNYPRRRREFQIELWRPPLTGQALQRVAILRDVLEATAVRTEGEADQLTLRLALTDPAELFILDDMLIRTQRLGGADVEFWRITSLERSADESGTRILTIACLAAWQDLGRTTFLADKLDSTTLPAFARALLTPTQIVDEILGQYNGGLTFLRGTIQPTAVVASIGFEFDTPLSGLLKLAEQVQARVRPVWDDDALAYRVHLDDLSTQTAVFNGAIARPEVNLVSISETVDATTRGTVFYGKGNATHLGDAQWRVTSAVGDRVTLVAPDGDYGPVPDAGWLVGYRLQRIGTRLPVAITATTGSVTTPSVVTVPGHTFVIGDAVQLLDPTGAVALAIAHPTTVSVSGPLARLVERADIGLSANLVPNPYLDFVNGQPTRWEPIGSTVVISGATGAGQVLYGTAAARIRGNTGDGIRSAPFTWSPISTQPVIACATELVMTAGTVRVTIVSETNGQVYPLGAVASATAMGRFTPVITLGDLPAGQYRVVITITSATADVVLDACTATAATASEAQGIIPLVSGPQRLWQETGRIALTEGLPTRVYSATLVNLFALDPEQYAHQRLIVGDEVRLYDPQLRIAVGVRLVGLSERLDTLDLSQTQVVLSTKRTDISPVPVERPIAVPRLTGALVFPAPRPPGFVVA